MTRARLFQLSIIVVLLSDAALAAETDSSYDGFQIFIENDKYSGFKKTDQWYTNGLRLVLLPREVPFESGKQFASWVGHRFGDGESARFGLTFGQDIYTPKNISNPDPQPFDRPWAGWLYVGFLGQVNNAKRGTQVTAELDLGVVGPASGAKWAQTTVHRALKIDEPRGWDNQLKNELGIVLNVRKKHRYALVSDASGEVDLDLIPQYGIAVGNVFTYAAGGAMLRWGSNLSGFGDDRLTHTLEGKNEERPFTVSSRFGVKEWYVFARGESRLVARNIFLDGNTFRDSASVKRKRYVFEGSLGASIRFSGGLRATYVHNRRSQEFERTDGTPNGTPRYGTLIFAYEF
jgi:lipid A 3-O-deacylase